LRRLLVRRFVTGSSTGSLIRVWWESEEFRPGTFDRFNGGHQDTLGGIYSALKVDHSATIGQRLVIGLLSAQPDRGFGDGAQDYHPRREAFAFLITPVAPGAQPGAGAAFPQNQIQLFNYASILYRATDWNHFTGFDANDPSQQFFPQAIVPANLPGATPGVHRSLDPEGIASGPRGHTFVSDEYGPFIYRFDLFGRLIQTIVPPSAYIPRYGDTLPRTTNFTGNDDPVSGRRSNRGLEGLTITPDGSKLVAMLQSPLIQDGGANNKSQNTRILIFDARTGSLLHEYVYSLTLKNNGNNTPISEILALNDHQFLVLERDNLGRGSGRSGVPVYKRIVLADTHGAKDLAGTGYDLELGVQGQLSLPLNDTGLEPEIKPVVRHDFIDLLDPAQLAKFGLNVKADADSDNNSITEKWEGLALIPINPRKSEFLLLVGNDNDFKAAQVYHNGAVVGTNAQTIDSLLFAYRVVLPGAR
jgi:hypothetical protein